MTEVEVWRSELQTILQDFEHQVTFEKDSLFVIGCSTSEVIGKKIGTSGTFEAATMIFEELHQFSERHGIRLAFQCCEHLNRALVVQKSTAEMQGLEPVTVIPVRQAGGAMAAHAYRHMTDPVVVEHIKADAGIDIGDTFIGMHLKAVAVPIRSSLKQVGQAHVTMAKTRPKLIGGVRAVYEAAEENESCR
ncbi:TIGR01440 family protein [Bacillus sp. FJAT-42376]|uniref:TIGR01440 family protein n=1 Tax=Bacillus sp. FJAT-42376 TaxID=2014076 RepID=UPI000F4F1603|nr:TIGR01440 family protein [Bacillus sp. FJAT-42376]AZB40911.1 TIGR01440 family protein [Bacillus sp. FJAT-42376]